ncbi:MAG TPA: polysaccharide deacetylase family protein [Steroidobacteraceae bacterium]|nr:polysaccharide deacetylase family protein [Steroidobacteraceae bacterium]
MPDSTPRTGYRPSATIRASLALHVGAAAAVCMRPQAWPWALGAVVADHLLLTGAGLWPRSSLLGPNWTHLPPAFAPHACIALTIDDGPDPEVTPRVLDLLDEGGGARATFFCIGERVLQHPALAREIVRRGHAVENHSQRHLHRFALLGPSAMAAEITRAQQAIRDTTGEAPRFFRAPAGLRNPFLEALLVRAQLRLTSWTRRGFDTRNGNADSVLGRLTRDLASGDILLLHDGHAARTAAGAPVILTVLPRLLASVAAAGLRSVTLRATLPPAAP